MFISLTLLAGCGANDGNAVAEECGGHGHLHGDHCDCDVGYQHAEGDDETCVAAPASSECVAGSFVFTAVSRSESLDTYAFAMNAGGTMVGRIGDGESGDGWFGAEDAAETFDFPGAPFTEAFDIDDEGTISGWFKDPEGVSHGFVRSPDGEFAQVDVPGAPWTIVLARNEAGQIAGFYGDPADEAREIGFLRTPDGEIQSFEVPGAATTEAYDIGADGSVVGVYTLEGDEPDEHGHATERGFHRGASGTIEKLSAPCGAVAGAPLGINGMAQTVGYFEDDHGVHGFLRNEDGTTEILDAPDAAGFTVPLKLTDDGTVLGYFADAEGRIRGFVATRTQ